MKHRKIVLTVEHMKDGPDGARLGYELVPIAVGRDADGDDITSCVVQPAVGPMSGEDDGPSLPAQARMALSILRDLISERGEPFQCDDASEEVEAVQKREWRLQCKERHLAGSEGEEAFKKAFSRARRMLEEASIICVSKDGWVYLPLKAV